MRSRRWTLAAALVSLAGAGGVAVGTWLPWLAVRPGRDEPVPAVHPSAMDSGLAGVDWLLLAVAAVGLLGVALADRSPDARLGGARAAGVTIVAGGLAAAVAVVALLSNGLLGTFVPAAGFYLTVLGGVHLSVGGVLRLRSVVGE